MLTVESFSQSDLQRIDSIPKSFKVIGIVFLVLCVPASFLFGLVGLTQKGLGYWVTTLTLLAFFAICVSLVIIKDYWLYHKDKTTQQKYRGIINVIGKSTKKVDKVIFTDIPELKKINLYTGELYEKISIGDNLTIEISKFSKTLFRLDKNQIDLLNGH